MMTTVEAVMRRTETLQVSGATHGREAIEPDDIATLASRPNVFVRQNAVFYVKERMICGF